MKYDSLSLEELEECFNKNEELFRPIIEELEEFEQLRKSQKTYDCDRARKLGNKALEIVEDLGSLCEKIDQLDFSKRYERCSSRLFKSFLCTLV
ncbi:hypothetical protein [Helicobacter cetorum]|uniref:hypothetical protein n=1 Tax=Helicobacter cetorum TaxID=138563 RepID=UPI000CF06C0E|nr:hypothetical protein [Helicobacter cetorum]